MLSSQSERGRKQASSLGLRRMNLPAASGSVQFNPLQPSDVGASSSGSFPLLESPLSLGSKPCLLASFTPPFNQGFRGFQEVTTGPQVEETHQGCTIETLLVSVYFTLIYIYTGHNKKAITQQFSELLPSFKNACSYKGEVETLY